MKSKKASWEPERGTPLGIVSTIAHLLLDECDISYSLIYLNLLLSLCVFL